VLALARSVDSAAVAAAAAERGLTGPAVGEAIHQARVNGIAAGLDDPARSG
jgi:tRNA nucleotidyltransferase (CCA-adding enzyme)